MVPGSEAGGGQEQTAPSHSCFRTLASSALGHVGSHRTKALKEETSAAAEDAYRAAQELLPGGCVREGHPLGPRKPPVRTEKPGSTPSQNTGSRPLGWWNLIFQGEILGCLNPLFSHPSERSLNSSFTRSSEVEDGNCFSPNCPEKQRTGVLLPARLGQGLAGRWGLTEPALWGRWGPPASHSSPLPTPPMQGPSPAEPTEPRCVRDGQY